MELTTLETVPGKAITRHLGLVQGSTVRSKHAGKDILAGLKNFVGGELKSYTALLNESRTEAIDRMVEQAREAGANAVVNIRFSTSNIAAGAAEVFVRPLLHHPQSQDECLDLFQVKEEGREFEVLS